MKSPKKYLFPFLSYFLLFSLLFFQFPFSGSLPGKSDNWFFLAAYRNIGNYIYAFINNIPIGTAVYPESNVYSFGNYSPGQALLFLPFIWVGISDLYSYYLFNSILFAFNAFAVYLVACELKISRLFAFLSGLFFTGSNFAYGNLDNPDALFLGFGLLSIFYLLKFFRNFQDRNLLLSFFLLGVEVYFSSYGFLFCSLTFALICLFQLNKLLSLQRLAIMLGGVFILLFVLYPYLSVYIFSPPIKSAYNPAETISATGKASLKLIDFLRPLKNTLYYSALQHGDSNWINKTKSAFVGVIMPIIGIWGISRFRGVHKKILISTFVIFLFVAFGPFLPLENTDIPSPLYWLYQKFGINQYLRISVRSYFFCVLVFSIGAAKFLEWIYFSLSVPAAFILSFLIFIENTPYSFEKYESKKLIDLSFRIPNFENQCVILNLPSSIYSGYYPLFKPECIERKDYEFEATREHIYMYQQTLHSANTINGLTGFIPTSRIKNQLLIDRITSGEITGLDQLIKKNRLTHIIWQKKLTNGCNYSATTQLLRTSPQLKKETENEDITVYIVITRK